MDENVIIRKKQPTAVRRIQIKNAVLAILTEKGINQLSWKNIAKECSLSEGAIYRHFKSQDAILQSIIIDYKESLLQRLKEITLSKESAEKRLDKFICTQFTHLNKNKGLNLLIFSQASYSNSELLLSTLKPIFNLQKKYLCKIIMDGIIEGVWCKTISPEALSELYMGIPLSINIEADFNKSQPKDYTYCREVQSFILKILSK